MSTEYEGRGGGGVPLPLRKHRHPRLRPPAPRGSPAARSPGAPPLLPGGWSGGLALELFWVGSGRPRLHPRLFVADLGRLALLVQRPKPLLRRRPLAGYSARRRVSPPLSFLFFSGGSEEGSVGGGAAGEGVSVQ